MEENTYLTVPSKGNIESVRTGKAAPRDDRSDDAIEAILTRVANDDVHRVGD